MSWNLMNINLENWNLVNKNENVKLIKCVSLL